MIAFYGMGLLGLQFARALRRPGEQVRVWNRSPEKARALIGEGATFAEDAAQAARGASRIHLTLSDDAAFDNVLEQARPGIEKDTVIVDHTTQCRPPGTRLGRRWAERGIAFQQCPRFHGAAKRARGNRDHARVG